MTSMELKHQARLQEWGSAIKECRSSGQSVREWCRQQGITPTTYYRWEREVLSVAESMAQQDGQESVTFAKAPVPRQEYRNEAEHSARTQQQSLPPEQAVSLTPAYLLQFSEFAGNHPQ